MKKLLPLLLLGVAVTFFSCESYSKNEGKEAMIKAAFETAQTDLTIEENTTVNVVLSKPAEQNVFIPFELGGDAIEGTDYEILDIDNYEVMIPKGQTTGSIELKHLFVNAVKKDAKIILKRGDGYALGNNKQILVKLGAREKVFVTFTEKIYTAREFTNIDISIKLTGEKSEEDFVAHQAMNFYVTPLTPANAPTVSSAPASAWSWGEASSSSGSSGSLGYITIPEGGNEGSVTMRVRWVNRTLPSDPSDPQPSITPGEDWPEGHTYRLGLTLSSNYAGTLGDGFEFGEVDTAFLYIKRIEDPIGELLVGKKWINPTFALDETPFASNRNGLLSLMNFASDPSWSIMPRENKPGDNFTFYKNEENGHYYVNVDVQDEFKQPDPSQRSDIGKFFKSGPSLFVYYQNLDLLYHPLGSGAPGFTLYMPANKRFRWDQENITHPDPEEEREMNPNDMSTYNYSSGVHVYIIPSSLTGDTDDLYFDMIVLGGQWDKTEGNFFWDMYEYRYEATEANPNPNKVFTSTRYWDIWYRLYRDLTPEG